MCLWINLHSEVARGLFTNWLYLSKDIQWAYVNCYWVFWNWNVGGSLSGPSPAVFNKLLKRIELESKLQISNVSYINKSRFSHWKWKVLKDHLFIYTGLFFTCRVLVFFLFPWRQQQKQLQPLLTGAFCISNPAGFEFFAVLLIKVFLLSHC